MVFLRLTVKVRPREQVDQDSRSTVTPNGTTNGADSAAATPGKTIIFQLPVRDPDSITLARLAALIQEKWKLLRPYSPWVFALLGAHICKIQSNVVSKDL